jgi:hypothetical protein
MATARAQGGLGGEVGFFTFQYGVPVSSRRVRWSTRVRHFHNQGRAKVQSQDLAPGDRVSHRMEPWSSAEMNPYWVTYSRTLGLVSVWTCFPPPPHRVHYDNR